MSYNLTVARGVDVDPHTLDWRLRQARALVPFDLDTDGLPLNPHAPHLPAGRGQLRHWGEAVAADAVVIATTVPSGRHVLLVERGDGHGWAVPGGMLDDGETPLQAAVRELEEETGLRLSSEGFRTGPGRYVPDPRAARHAWMVTVPSVRIMFAGDDGDLPAVAGADDARRAAWIRANDYDQMLESLRAYDGCVFASHVDLLRSLLD